MTLIVAEKKCEFLVFDATDRRRVRVTGYAVLLSCADAPRIAVHRPLPGDECRGEWVCTHWDCGAVMACGNTKREAVAKAVALWRRYDPQKRKARVAEATRAFIEAREPA